MVYDPFAQGSALDPQQYMDFLQQPTDPRLLSAGLSAGLSLMQPPRWGDTGASELARAIGIGGESVAQSEAASRAERESQSKIDTQEARAEAARSRAESAATRAGAAGDRLSYQQERNALLQQGQESLNERSRLSRLVQANGQYQQYVKAVQAQNNDPLNRTPQPVLDFNTWLTNAGLGGLLVPGSSGATLGTSSAAPQPAAAAAPAAPTTSAGPAPVDATKRVANTVYSTPKGDLRWTGTGWVQP